MEHRDLINAVSYIRPQAKFVIRGEEIEWMDEEQIQPTAEEIKAGWIAYQAKESADSKATAQAKAALLERLGITEDEAKLLLS